jgi:hypothetical protein
MPTTSAVSTTPSRRTTPFVFSLAGCPPPDAQLISRDRIKDMMIIVLVFFIVFLLFLV